MARLIMLLLKQCVQFIFNSFELEPALIKPMRFPSQRAGLLVNVAAAEPRGPCLQLYLCIAACQAKRVDFFSRVPLAEGNGIRASFISEPGRWRECFPSPFPFPLVSLHSRWLKRHLVFRKISFSLQYDYSFPSL